MNDLPAAGDDLTAFLDRNASPDVARALAALAAASIVAARRIRRGAFDGGLHGDAGSCGDSVAAKALDAFAHEAFVAGLRGAGVRGVVSEERQEPVAVDADGTLLVALDPLDGSSNIDANVTVGTVFSVLDAPPGPFDAAHFLQPGTAQRAAGIVVYGLHVAFAFTVGRGVAVAALDPETETWRIVASRLAIPAESSEFAINCANTRHWPDPVQAYVADLLEGEDGPRGEDFTLRWVGAMVAEAYRILIRGGVYLYPADAREGYERGRLGLLTQANPVAFLVEQAGGAAIDGYQRLLDVEPRSIHVRTPLVFGAREKVERIARYYREEAFALRAPLFGKRGLLRR
ncbi:D-fructose 1,6-bisphosphatase [Roseiarcus fermentans]|uniref:Fructose-1,6-bisphosphatase class 1 n=1 Tax=Roseiarcus fermentans TaxID=1473586 RepID=A0A366F9M5_9HYPH|nr:class 1 fructose-bisphosphatase [Roseiarcus fermentans]RBP11317.1 D-fructose 1,6-bisphosphatase [Roseiarcus fermentans]